MVIGLANSDGIESEYGNVRVAKYALRGRQGRYMPPPPQENR